MSVYPPNPPPVGGQPSSSDKLWAILSHLSGFLGVPFLLPLVVHLVMRGDSPYVGHHSGEALNFHLSVFIYLAICFPLCWVIIGIPMMFVITIASAIVSVIAAVKASNGESYRYPLTIRLIK